MIPHNSCNNWILIFFAYLILENVSIPLHRLLFHPLCIPSLKIRDPLRFKEVRFQVRVRITVEIGI
jgi:hypothetical protein